MTWDSINYLKKLNTVYRSSVNVKNSENVFQHFFHTNKYFFVKCEYHKSYFKDKKIIKFEEEEFKKNEIGFEYTGGDFSFDTYLEFEGDYFAPLCTFDILLNEFLEGTPLLQIISENSNTLISGGLFARLFVHLSKIDENSSDIMEVFDESDIDIYVNYQHAKKLLESFSKNELFYILDVNSPSGYNSFLQRNKILYRVRCCLNLKRGKIPLDIMITEDDSVNIIKNFDLSASQWAFDGKELKYHGTKKEDFFNKICHVNPGYIQDVLCGNQITLKRIRKYSYMSFVIKMDETKQVTEKVSIANETFPNLLWFPTYTYKRKFLYQISKEQWEKVSLADYRHYKSSLLTNITQNHYYVTTDEEGDSIYYYPVNFERVIHQKIKSCGFTMLKKWTFVNLFLDSTLHKQYVSKLNQIESDGIKIINKYWLEVIFKTNEKDLGKWEMSLDNTAWLGMLNFLRQTLKSESRVKNVLMREEVNKLKEYIKGKDQSDLKNLYSNYNSLVAISFSMFQSSDFRTKRTRELIKVYGTIKWLKRYFTQDVFVTTNKDYIYNTLNLWRVGDSNTVSLNGIKWIHQPYDPVNNFFFVQLSWWSRGAMKERVLYCYNNFMNINKVYPWLGSGMEYKSLFTSTEHWYPDMNFLKNHQKYIFISVSISDGHFLAEPNDYQDIINVFVQKYKDEYFPDKVADLQVLRDLIISKPYFSFNDFSYEFITASLDDNDEKMYLCIDSIYIPEKLLLSSSPFDFSKTPYKTVFDIEFDDPLMFEKTTIEKYLKEDFRTFVIIVKGPKGYEDLITTSWIDKLPNGMDDFNKISNCYFKSRYNNKPHTIYRRMGNNRTLIAEDYLSRCAFSNPELKSPRDYEEIGPYMYWRKACDAYGRPYVPRGKNITNLLSEDQKDFIIKKSKETNVILDTQLENMCENHDINFYDFYVQVEDYDEISIWIPVTKKMKDGDYSEPLLDFEHRVMLVDVEEINNGSSDDYVTVGNPDFWCIDYPYNIFGYQGDIHTHLGASQHTDLERFSVRAEVKDNRVWDTKIVDYFTKRSSIDWRNIFQKDQIMGTPLNTITAGNVPTTPDTFRTPAPSPRRIVYDEESEENLTPGVRTPNTPEAASRSPTQSEAASTLVESPVISLGEESPVQVTPNR